MLSVSKLPNIKNYINEIIITGKTTSERRGVILLFCSFGVNSPHMIDRNPSIIYQFYLIL